MFPYDLQETNPNKLLINNFEYNGILVRAMMELFSYTERVLILSWLTKFKEMCDTPENILYRSHYMWFLLLNIFRNKLNYPFDRRPPIGQLKPLHEVLPIEVYEDIVQTALASLTESTWVDEMAKGAPPLEEDESLKGLFPQNFFPNMPVPAEGAFCYAAVFSDYGTTPDMVE